MPIPYKKPPKYVYKSLARTPAQKQRQAELRGEYWKLYNSRGQVPPDFMTAGRTVPASTLAVWMWSVFWSSYAGTAMHMRPVLLSQLEEVLAQANDNQKQIILATAPPDIRRKYLKGSNP